MASDNADENCLHDEWFEVKCTICMRKNRPKEAKKYCRDCRKNLCLECERVHKEHNEDHLIVDGHGDDDAKGSPLVVKCEVHQDKMIEMFCENHEELLCNVCALQDHRKCDDLKSLADFAHEPGHETKARAVRKQLESAMNGLDGAITALDQTFVRLSHREQQFLDEVDEYAKQIIAKVNTLRTNAKQLVTTRHKQCELDVKKKIKVCSTFKTEVDKSIEDIKQSPDEQSLLFIMTKKGQRMAKIAEDVCRDSKDLVKQTQLLFKADRELWHSLTASPSLFVEVKRLTASLEDKFFISLSSDSQSCDIEGCTMLSNNILVIVDHKNRTIKRFNTPKYELIGTSNLIDASFGVACISADEFAVGSSTSGVIVKSLDKKQKTRKLKVDCSCYRIAYSNGELFLSDGCVHVYDLNGTLIRTICKKKSGERLYSSIKGIALNEAGDRVFVADQDLGLICTDREGREIFTLSNKKLGLSGAYGVCTYKTGNVLVCDPDSNNVVQATETGLVVGEILTRADGVKRPRCICFDPASQKLYIGGGSNKMLVFKFISRSN